MRRPIAKRITAALVRVICGALLVVGSVGLGVPARYARAEGAFTDTGVSLQGMMDSAVAWGDYDNDLRLDVILTGRVGHYGLATRLYHNNGDGTFNLAANTGLPDIGLGSVAWGDADNDNRLDLLLVGCVEVQGACVQATAGVYHNNGNGTFSNSGAVLPGLWKGAVAWGDYDNDGRLDLVLDGYTTGMNAQQLTRIYHNDGHSVFSDIGAPLPGLVNGDAAWGDYDGDGRLDLLLNGTTGTALVTKLYHNAGDGTFSETAANLPGLNTGRAVWGDFDNDGRPDILLSGCINTTTSCGFADVFHNNGNGTFTALNAGLPGAGFGALAAGDFDNDGKLDVAIAGSTGWERLTWVYHNNGDGTFTRIATMDAAIAFGDIAAADFDKDGRLDLLVTGQDSFDNQVARLYRNTTPAANTAPQAPSGLTADIGWGVITLRWEPAVDAETPTAGLTYNVHVVNQARTMVLLSSQSDRSTGVRFLPQPGNAGQALRLHLKLRSYMWLCWTVQAVDSSFAASPFAPWQCLRYPPYQIALPLILRGR